VVANNPAVPVAEQQILSRKKQHRRGLVHRVCINGHQTSISLEPELHYPLRRIAAELGTTATTILEAISMIRRPERSFCSEIRVFVATHYARKVPQTGFPDPASRFSFRVVHRRCRAA
jgi:predicted DNA-binding ribbon-helix-helix protein